jgi:HPt (histidine-containing phosphotransfer) domain-containing protein
VDAPPPLFDRSPIDDICRDLGAERTRALLAQCMASMDKYLSEIRRCAAAGDPVNAKRAAHDLKGICAQFGAARAGVLARRIELEAEDAAAIGTIAAGLAESLTRAQEKIAEIRATL